MILVEQTTAIHTALKSPRHNELEGFVKEEVLKTNRRFSIAKKKKKKAIKD